MRMEDGTHPKKKENEDCHQQSKLMRGADDSKGDIQ